MNACKHAYILSILCCVCNVCYSFSLSVPFPSFQSICALLLPFSVLSNIYVLQTAIEAFEAATTYTLSHLIFVCVCVCIYAIVCVIYIVWRHSAKE